MSTKPLVTFLATMLLGSALPAMAAGNSVARIEANGCEQPHFPARWQTEGDGATVVVGYLVTAAGKVVDSKIVQSSGLAYIDRASERAGARCKFVPAGDSSADAAWTQVKYSWTVK